MSGEDILEIGEDGTFVIPEAPKKGIQLTAASSNDEEAVYPLPVQSAGTAASTASSQEYIKKIFASINVNEYKIYDNVSDSSLNIVARLSSGERPTAIALEDGVLEIETSDNRCLTIPVDYSKVANKEATTVNHLKSEFYEDIVVIKLLNFQKM